MDEVDSGPCEAASIELEDAGLRALAERRLLQIGEILGVDPDRFRQGDPTARLAQTVAQATDRLTEAVLKLSNPTDRDRAVDFIETLASRAV